jgi:hypothetical protein
VGLVELSSLRTVFEPPGLPTSCQRYVSRSPERHGRDVRPLSVALAPAQRNWSLPAPTSGRLRGTLNVRASMSNAPVFSL